MSRSKRNGGNKSGRSSARSAFAQAATHAGLVARQGKEAVEGRHRSSIVVRLASSFFTGSVDMDGAFRQSESASHQWDYGLGVQAQGKGEIAVWVEPHSASSIGQVDIVLAKLDWLQAKLQDEKFKSLKALTDECVRQGYRPFHWMATAHVGIRPGTPAFNKLSARGVSLSSRRVVI
jgi:hypothetical protein